MRSLLLVTSRGEDLAAVTAALGSGWAVTLRPELQADCLLVDRERFAPGGGIPVVVLADPQEVQAALACLAQGADDYLSRDQWDQLEATLEKAVQRRAGSSRMHQQLAQANRRLDVQAGRFHDLFELAPVGYLTLNSRGLILEANHPAGELLGLPHLRLQGWPLANRLDRPSRAAFREFLAIQSKTPRSLRVTLAGGRALQLHGRLNDGLLYLALVPDGAAERELAVSQESEAVQRAIMGTVNDGVLLVDAEERVIFANQAAERSFRSPARQLEGRLLGSLVLQMPPPSGSPAAESQLARPDGSRFLGIVSQVPPRAGRRRRLVIVRDLSESHQSRREFAQVVERERRRIGQDLHDDLGQQLTALAYVASVLERRLEDEALRPLGQRVAELSRQAVSKVRGLARGLYPQTLQMNGLVAALRELAAIMGELFAVDCTFEADGEPRLPEEPATHLYRLAQEALSNAVRHARPARIRVELRSGPEGLTLVVEDDGRGMPARPPSEGLGLRSMRQHAHMVGGELEISTSRWGGARVAVHVGPQARRSQALETS